jgi:hypothetical protein
MPIPGGVAIPGATQLVKEGAFQASEMAADSARATLDTLHKWAVALKPMRE